uniref:Uncharacterized protein n=1 Tax=Opuntia streptacantha TaxID=393608 RepID=A0A7C8YM37_OPUST
MSLFAIPFRRYVSRTATFEMYAIPVLLWRSGPFLGRKSATVSIVSIPATKPLFRLNLLSKPPILRSSLLKQNASSSELPMTATKQVLLQPVGTESPKIIPTSLSILKIKSNGKEYSGKKDLQ